MGPRSHPSDGVSVVTRPFIPAGATGELGYIRDVLERERAPGSGPTMFSAEFVEAAFRSSIELVDQIARLRTDSETAGGMSGDDAVETIGSLVRIARSIVGDPGYPEADG